MDKYKVLIVDDEPDNLALLYRTLRGKYDIAKSTSPLMALEMLKQEHFHCILSDHKMPEMDGVEVLEKIVESGIDSSVVMISGHGTIDTAVECIKKGAFDFIQKPLDLNRIFITLKNATDKTSLIKETKVLKRKVSGVQEIIGESAAIKKIKEMIDRVAATDARVLITGSNGTGKELVARWLHEKSNRSSMPFVEVNCAAIPGDKGKFEQADGGTLFLDEIGDMSLAAQAKVLRVLQENKLTRVGSDKDIRVNVRVVAATNKNLLEEIEKGNFREDLYHRLSVIIIHVPPLKDRIEDIPVLVKHFISTICAENGMPERQIADDAVAELQNHNWTGNIRELRNVTERLLILGGPTITREDVLTYATPNL